MAQRIRVMGTFVLVLVVTFSVMIPHEAATAREFEKITPNNPITMGADYFSGYLYGHTTRCHDLPADKRSYNIHLNTNGITDFFLLENYSSYKVRTTRVEFGTGYIYYYRYSYVTRLQICATNLYVNGSSYNIRVYSY